MGVPPWKWTPPDIYKTLLCVCVWTKLEEIDTSHNFWAFSIGTGVICSEVDFNRKPSLKPYEPARWTPWKRINPQSWWNIRRVKKNTWPTSKTIINQINLIHQSRKFKGQIAQIASMNINIYLVVHPTNRKWVSSPQLQVDIAPTYPMKITRVN